MVALSLDALARASVLAPVDVHFAKLLGRLGPPSNELVLVAGALSSRAVRLGHVCVDLQALAAAPLVSDGPLEERVAFELPRLPAWLDALGESHLVDCGTSPRADAGRGRSGDGHGEASRGDPRPLVLRGGRLYLARYHRYETELAEALVARSRKVPTFDVAGLKESVGRLFPNVSDRGDLQRLAVVLAALRSLLVVSGGPGTGKTYTVAKLLAVLLEQARASGAPAPRILLLAPTGKAARRLAESIQSNIDGLPCDAGIRAQIPREASTIHRALGYLPAARTRFRHDRDFPLPADVVLVDEASMVDVALMTKLARAVPEPARLVLVGDKNQLASVEAGSILGDIYGADAERPGYSRDVATAVAAVTGEQLPAVERTLGVGDCRVHLTVSRRYAPTSGIARVAAAINAGDAQGALAVLGSSTDARLLPPPPPRALDAALGEPLSTLFGAFRRASPADRLARMDALRILCVHRRGPYGVETVNAWAERYLLDAGMREEGAELYDGRPILVTENDHQLELYNGDIGVLARTDKGDIEACFAARDGIRRLSPARLPPHETVFAMTVHKSQGSEFDHVLLLLPAEPSPLLTRELLYTAVTRARSRVEIYGTAAVLAAGIEARISRASGLGEALGAPTSVSIPPRT